MSLRQLFDCCVGASVVLATFAACSSSDELDLVAARQIPVSIRSDATSIAQANNQFACDLYAQLANTDGNQFFSPFSISTALAMVDAGAAGTTDLELRTALHLDLPGARTHAAFGAILGSLDVGRSHGAYTLATANGVFGQVGFPFLPTFQTTIRQDYGADLVPVDFKQAPDAARTTVNDWVAARTDDKIPALFGPGSLGAATRIALANAIVFKGRWAEIFDDAKVESFRLGTGNAVQVPMMHKTDLLSRAEIPGGTIGLLPFNGKDLSMVILLPDQDDGLPAIEAELTGPAIAQWIADARPTAEKMPIALPRFNLATKPPVLTALGNLGVTSAFSPLAADFSGIDGRRDLHLDAVVHQAMIQVDESGAEAVAATGGALGTASVGAGFVVDHPFVFAIFDHVTGTILFMGRVADPTRT